MFAAEQQAREMFAQLSSRDTRACVGEEAADDVADAATGTDAAQLTIGQPSTARVQADPVGDERAGGRVTVPLEAEGVNVNLTGDLVFVRVGRGVALLTFSDVVMPFDEDLRADLTSKVVRRLSAELN